MAQDGEIRRHPNGGTYIRQNGQWVLQSAPQSAPGAIQLAGPDPEKPLDVTIKGQQIAKGSRDAALDARIAPLKVKQAELAIRNAELATERAERELKTGGAKGDAKTASLNALVEQINRVQELYEANIAPTSGVTGALDFLPTEANSQFNAAGAGLAEQGLAAFRVPGVGSQSDTELRQFVEANRPQASDFDLRIEEKLRQLRNRVDATRSSMGLDPATWVFDGKPQRRDDAALGAGAPASGEGGGPGPDRTTALLEGGGGGDAISLTQGATRTINNPALAGVNARVNKMLQDRASDADIVGYLRGVGVDPNNDPKLATSLARAFDFRRKNPNYSGGYKVDLEGTIEVPLGGWVAQSLNKLGQGPVGAHAINAMDMMTLGNLDSMTENPEVARALMAGVQAENPKASFTGSLLGGALAAGAGELGAATGLARLGAQRFAPVLGDALFGAAYGAGSSDDDRLGGALSGGLTAVGGGMFGRSATRGAGRALTGARDASTRYLAERGVPLTLGQVAGQGGVVGRTIRGLEDKLESVPLIGDAIRARRTEGVRAFNRATMGQALEPIGAEAAGEVGEEGIDAARGLVGQAYRDSLSGVQVAPDAQFMTEIEAALARGQQLPGNMADEFGFTFKNRVLPEFENGALTGEGYQAVRQGLRRDRKGMLGQPRGHDFGDVIRNVEAATEGLVRRGAPDVVPGLNRADAAYRNLKVVEDAVGRGVNTEGLFTPAQLGMAARANAKRFGGNQATSQRPFFDLQRNAQNVLPSQVPNSGTTDRAIGAALLPAAVGGAAYGLDFVDPEEAALLASFGLPYTKVGRAALQKTLVSRPDAVRRVGEDLIRNARVGGMLGAGGVTPLALTYGAQ